MYKELFHNTLDFGMLKSGLEQWILTTENTCRFSSFSKSHKKYITVTDVYEIILNSCQTFEDSGTGMQFH